MRWHRFNSGQQLLALFPDFTSGRWAAWTPHGFYMASPGGEEFVPLGWQFNRGPDVAADFYPAHLYRDLLYRPDVLQQVIETADLVTPVRSSGSSLLAELTNQAPPVVEVAGPIGDRPFAGRQMSFELSVRSPSGKAVDHVTVRLDGVFQQRVVYPSQANSSGRLRLDVSAPPRDTAVTFIAHAGGVASLPVTVSLKWKGPPAKAATKPRLRGLVIGVNATNDPAFALSSAVNDASHFNDKLLGQKGKAYRHVETRVLVHPNRGAVLEGMKWLHEGSRDDDVSLLFFAGHGVTDVQRRFFLIAADTDIDALGTTGVSGAALIEMLRALRGRVIAFIDACHSADTFMGRGDALRTIDMSRFTNDATAADNGVMIVAASTARQEAFESGAWGDNNGAFTSAILEGLAGAADSDGDGLITTGGALSLGASAGAGVDVV